ncbi:MAG TPA: ABC transporter substrate-binding protein [Chloroflexota bacterium]|nr:ABC transporter substrate-binding protein [Chloroflexota bacterium]
MAASSGEKALKLGIVARSQYAALKNESVKPRGATLECVEVAPMPRLFDRMIKDREFDASEMAIVTYLQGREFGEPFTAIPVFPLRAFPHGTILYNVNAGVQSPKDLEGKRIGVRAYAGTAGVWARGLLQSEYGVDPAKVTWIINDLEHIAAYQLPANVQLVKGANLAEMLTSGEIAAGIGVMGVDSPEVKPLIPNPRQAQVEWFRKTGVFPMNNTVVVKNELLTSDPGLAESLFGAFRDAKADYLRRLSEPGEKTRDEEADRRLMEIVGSDPLPVGIDANRKALEMIVQFCYDQQIIARKPDVDVLFAPATRTLT